MEGAGVGIVVLELDSARGRRKRGQDAGQS